MNESQLFDPNFEKLWGDFDRRLRAELLTRAQKLGSFYRLSGSNHERKAAVGLMFYQALEAALTEDWLKRLRSSLSLDVDASFDDLNARVRAANPHPLHAFMALIVYIHEFPFRAFFSGRDEALSFNTLVLRMHQKASEALPTAVDYGLHRFDLANCPGSALDSPALRQDDEEKKGGEHPRNHFGYIDPLDPLGPGIPFWYWHF